MENLVKIQNELKVPKGNFNDFGKYRYRSGEDILEAVKPLLLKYNAILILTDELEAVGDKIFLKAKAEISFLSPATSPQSSIGYAEMGAHKGMSSEQCTGTASSYARKYALNGLFLIDETQQDHDSNKKEIEPKKEIDISGAILKISKSSSLEDLKSIWNGFSVEEKNNPTLLSKKDEIKNKMMLTPTSSV